MKDHEQIRRVIDKWLWEMLVKSSYKHSISTGFEVCGRNIIIYTNYPGVLIGRAGVHINELKDELQNKGIKKKINIVELGSGIFTREIKVKRSWFRFRR